MPNFSCSAEIIPGHSKMLCPLKSDCKHHKHFLLRENYTKVKVMYKLYNKSCIHYEKV